MPGEGIEQKIQNFAILMIFIRSIEAVESKQKIFSHFSSWEVIRKKAYLSAHNLPLLDLGDVSLAHGLSVAGELASAPSLAHSLSSHGESEPHSHFIPWSI